MKALKVNLGENIVIKRLEINHLECTSEKSETTIEMTLNSNIEDDIYGEDYIIDCVFFGKNKKLVLTSFDPISNILTGRVIK